MNNDIVISVENLSKKYRIGGPAKSTTIRDKFDDFMHHPFGINKEKIDKQDFWALKDVSFEVKRGDVVGVIGRNGSGKSTLLKILSRIVEPTEGKVTLKGRVASLLEVGTGFNPELTGRENIFLNGAILGMSQKEIAGKFNEIVNFSGVEKFIDTPVKRYSSGMYVRLAFAVAAHLDTDILLVDEVLAVGDAEFQRKCLGKMRDLAGGGRTVLFVSHNMGAIRDIANSGIWINNGAMEHIGNINDSITAYLSDGNGGSHLSDDLINHPNRQRGMKNILRKICCKNLEGHVVNDFSQKDTITIEMSYSNEIPGLIVNGAGFNIISSDGIRVGDGNTYMLSRYPYSISQSGVVKFIIPAREFNPGNYFISPSIGSDPKKVEDYIESAHSFTIHQADIYGYGYLLTKADGITALDFKTEFNEI